MDRGTATNALFGALAGSGVAAALAGLALPEGSPYARFLILVGLVGMVVGFGGLLIMAVWPRKKKTRPADGGSTTARARGGGRITLEESYSTANTLADVEEDASIAAKRVVHDPARTARRRSVESERSPTDKNEGEPDDPRLLDS